MFVSSSHDKRIFPRHRLNLECNLILEGNPLNALITDISIGGVGFIAKDKSSLDSDSFNIKINNIDVDTTAKIAWSREMFSGLRVGIQKTGLLTGMLNNYRLSDILIGFQKLGNTGVLRIDTASSTKKVYFKQGDVIFSASNHKDERLGEILLEIGKINTEQYNKSVELMKSTGKRQGTVLVELGYLTPAELIWSVRYQVENIILNLFNLDEGTFIFEDNPLPIEEIITLKLSTGNLIYHGIKSIKDIEKISRNCPPVNSVLYYSSNPLNLFQEITLDDRERKLLSLIDGNRTIQDIIVMSPLDESETLKTIYALYNTQIIEVIEKGIIKPSVVQEEILKEPEPEIDSVIADKIEKLYRDYKSLGYHGVLDISRKASLDEIKSAYYKKAKEFHPDMHLHFQSDSLKEKLNTIFAYINEAYRVLTTSKDTQKTDITAPADINQGEKNKQLARMRFEEGKKCCDDNKYEEALTFLGQAIYLDNSVPEYHYYYGVSLLKNKKIKDAEESIKKAIQLDPYNSDYMAELGYIYLQLGFKTRAKNAFEKALKYNHLNDKAFKGLEMINT